MDHLKFYTTTAATALLRWLSLAGIGLVLSIIGIAIGVHLIGNTPGEGFHGAHAGGGLGALLGVLLLFKVDFWPMLLLVASLAFIVVYTMVASKVSLGFIIGRLYENKLSPVIGDKLTHTLSHVIAKKPEWLQSISNIKTLKDKLLSATDEDSSINKIQRKAMQYALKKVKLDDINVSASNPNLPNEISARVMAQLAEAASPSYTLFWIALGVHVLLAILAFLFDH